jgi:hypothetical protein
MPIIYRKGLPSTVIDSVETEINRTFPLAYRDFLGGMNGLYFSPPDFVQIPLKAVEEGHISFDRFFGVLPDEDCNDLVSFNKEFIEEIDFLSDAIAVGEDGGGNPYVIVKGEKGGVYYWDRTHLHESDSVNDFDIAEQNDSGNLFFIAPDFDQFYSLVMKNASGAQDFIEAV